MQSYWTFHWRRLGDWSVSELGFSVTVRRRTLCERTGGFARLKAALPPAPAAFDVSIIATSKVVPLGPTLVVAVAFAMESGAGTGFRLSKSGPVCAKNSMFESPGTTACQSNSRQTGRVPATHFDGKSSKNVPGL